MAKGHAVSFVNAVTEACSKEVSRKYAIPCDKAKECVIMTQSICA